MFGHAAIPIAILLGVGAVWAAYRASVSLRRGNNRRAVREGISFVLAILAASVAYRMRS